MKDLETRDWQLVDYLSGGMGVRLRQPALALEGGGRRDVVVRLHRGGVVLFSFVTGPTSIVQHLRERVTLYLGSKSWDVTTKRWDVTTKVGMLQLKVGMLQLAVFFNCVFNCVFVG